MTEERLVGHVAFALGVCGVIYGLVIGVLSVFMAGAGHGWTEGIYSAIAVVLAPMAGVAWAYRRHWLGKVLAVLALAPAACVDWFLGTHTSFADRVWTYMPGVFLLWLAMWLTWQALALGVLGSRLTRIGN